MLPPELFGLRVFEHVMSVVLTLLGSSDKKKQKQNWQNRNCNEHVNCPDTRVGARHGLGRENLSTMKLTLKSTFLKDIEKITLYNIEYTTRSEDKVQQNYKPQGIHLAKQLKVRRSPLQCVIHHMI